MLKVLLVVDTPDRASALQAVLAEIEGVLAASVREEAPDVVLIHTDAPTREVLEPIIRAAVQRLEAEHALRAELEEARARLEERKVVERAKGILMKQRQMSEDEAFAALRTLAMQRGIRLGEAARQVIDIASMLG